MAELRLAMWSGPRNISTAMMRAFENRDDTHVWDEPLYAFYLARTGSPHPGANEIIAAGETDWRNVVRDILGPIPNGRLVHFQKQMTHHLLDDVDREWLLDVTNIFLIRDPREVIASYARTRPHFTLADVGLEQQGELYTHLSERAASPPLVIDSRDVLQDPKGTLSALCEALKLPFSEKMLRWPKGPRETDGVWSKHWYDAVLESTGFAPYASKVHTLERAHAPLAEQCMALYERMHDRRIKA